jgi:diadenylate cyclase
MSAFDVIIINVYLLTIFTNMVKTKTIIQVYRFLKLLILGLFIIALIELIMDNSIVLWLGIAKFVPLVPLVAITLQTEAHLIFKRFGLFGTKFFSNTLEDQVKIELIKSIDFLSGKKIGALITFEKTISLDDFIATAYPINTNLSSEILSTIFFPNTPLHDGAVIVRTNRILCAGAYFPPTERLDIPKQLGSRHRAAIGISEVTDSLTIVVSEETGNISVAVDGYLDLDISKESLLLYLEKHLQN